MNRSLLSPSLSRSVRIVGAALVAAAVAVIWGCRIAVGRNVYVSGLGADGERTADLFNLALLAVAVGGLLIALGTAGRARGSTARAWSVSATLSVASGLFAVASQVTCTSGCPVPFTPASTVQDLVHTSAAVLGFAAAGAAILQTAVVASLRWRRLLAIEVAGAIVVTSSVGGLLSIFGVATGVGGWLELVATTIALCWLIAYALDLPRSKTAVGSLPSGSETRRSTARRPSEPESLTLGGRALPEPGAG